MEIRFKSVPRREDVFPSDCEVAGKSPAEINVEVEALHRNLAYLGSLLGLVREKLEPILTPVPLVSKKGPSEVGCISPMGRSIEGANVDLSEKIELVSALLSSIAVSP